MTFVPAPGAEPAVARIRASKAKFLDALRILHGRQARDDVIAEVTGYTRQHIRRTLDAIGLHQRWNCATEFRAILTPAELECCAEVRIRT